jgi:bifunctional non-homologous end joining protein LigD
VDFTTARKTFDKLVKEKTAKGYTPGQDGTPYQHTDKEQRSTGVLPQLLNPIDESEVEPFITNDRWWMQEKLDGRRILIRKDGTHITAINRTGLTVGLAQSIADAVGFLESRACLLDGEAVGDLYHAFDLLELDGMDLRPSPYAVRHENLLNLVDAVPSNQFLYVPAAVGTARKRAMLDRLRRENKEGVVFKDRQAPYTPGRPASGGTQRKLKFYSTASCIVAAVNGNKRSVSLDLFDGGQRVGVGSVTIPPNQPIPAAGAIAEVKYLYAYPGGCLYQPVLLGVRDDIAAEFCTLNQLKFKPADDTGDAGDDGGENA